MSSKVADLLKESKVFHIATIDGDQSRVRPFGAVAEIDNRVYLCTANTKAFYRQIKLNPKVEISAMLGEDKWLRISGTVKIDSQLSVKEKFLQIFPLPMYKADDGIFEVFFFSNGKATVYSFKGEPESFEF
jgi:uncharacterized pyridoxamine 5'-phosphate oxidase family protein